MGFVKEMVELLLKNASENFLSFEFQVIRYCTHKLLKNYKRRKINIRFLLNFLSCFIVHLIKKYISLKTINLKLLNTDLKIIQNDIKNIVETKAICSLFTCNSYIKYVMFP